MDVSTSRVVELPDAPISPWLRLAHIHGLPGVREADRAHVRILRDFELTLQLDGQSWLWSEADQCSVDLLPGMIGLVPPGFSTAWGDHSGHHIGVHFDLHAQPGMSLREHSLYFARSVDRHPAESEIPPFDIRLAGHDQRLLIPLVSAPPNPAWFAVQLRSLVDLWRRGISHSLRARLEAARVITAVLVALALPAAEQAGDRRVLALIRRLDEFIGTKVTVPELAALTGMPETSFREAFVRATGRPPRRYLEELRIERAARALIETDRSVAEIGSAVGYDDAYHFSRTFRRVLGLSPSDYRRRA